MTRESANNQQTKVSYIKKEFLYPFFGGGGKVNGTYLGVLSGLYVCLQYTRLDIADDRGDGAGVT